MVKVLYVHCDCGSPHSSGHYYTGEHCPFSGWVAPFVREALQAAIALERADTPLTIEALRRVGLSRKALMRVMIAEFPHAAAVPDALGVGCSGLKRPQHAPQKIATTPVEPSHQGTPGPEFWTESSPEPSAPPGRAAFRFYNVNGSPRPRQVSLPVGRTGRGRQ
jgi:hypothetical protein